MNGESLDEQLYLSPGTKVLRNKLGIQDAEALDFAERMLVRDRMAQGCPGGDFDLSHLQAIHCHLFQDVYDWAGESRPGKFGQGDKWISCHSLAGK